MKTRKAIIVFSSIATACLFLALGCEKDYYPFPPRFSDYSDHSTSAIHLHIPRIIKSAAEEGYSGYEVYVTVTDQDNHPMSRFEARNFLLQVECGDSGPVCIDNFRFSYDRERVPLVIGITMDYSGSMSATDIADMEVAVRRLIQLLDPVDHLQVIKFSSGVRVMNDFTTDRTALLNAVNTSFPGGWTAFYESVYIGLQNLQTFEKNSPARVFPALIAFTDGYDNNSVANLASILASSHRSQIPIYTVGLGNVDQGNMRNMAHSSGGNFVHVTQSSDIDDAFQIILHQMNSSYMFEFTLQDEVCARLDILLEASYENALGTHSARGKRSYFFY